MTNKEKILNYCEPFLNFDFDHVYSAIDVYNAVSSGRIQELDGQCPDNYGIDDCDELCDSEPIKYVLEKDQEAQCFRCWETALQSHSEAIKLQ